MKRRIKDNLTDILEECGYLLTRMKDIDYNDFSVMMI